MKKRPLAAKGVAIQNSLGMNYKTKYNSTTGVLFNMMKMMMSSVHPLGASVSVDEYSNVAS